MDQDIEDKLTLIKGALKTAGLSISEIAGGFRIRLDSGDHADIYVLSSSPDHVRARIKTKESDAPRRKELIESVQGALSRSLQDIARIEPFRISRQDGGVSIYNAIIEMETPYDGGEPIEIGADAIEIIAEGEYIPAIRLEDPDAFQFDFNIEGDNCLKTASSLAEKAMFQLESMDAKTLRQNLDMMGMKRSGTVRLALTRIFRSALEIKELESVIQSEAMKIVTPEDRMELQNLKKLSVQGLLDAVVDLLWQEVFTNQP